MKPFMDKNFLLSNETAQKLYFDYVIIFIKNRRYYVLMNDMYVVKYFGNEILINYFKNNHINYIFHDLLFN